MRRRCWWRKGRECEGGPSVLMGCCKGAEGDATCVNAGGAASTALRQSRVHSCAREAQAGPLPCLLSESLRECQLRSLHARRTGACMHAWARMGTRLQTATPPGTPLPACAHAQACMHAAMGV